MKKFRCISIILAITLIFSMISIVGAGAATKEATDVSVVSIPENLCDNDYEHFLNGIVLNITYTDKTTKQITLSSTNTGAMYEGENEIDSGYHNVEFYIEPDSTTTIMGSAEIYVSDFAELSFSIVDSGNYHEPVKYTYPSSFVCPKSFAKDYYCYSTNDNGTLTLVYYNAGNTRDEDTTLTVPQTVNGKTVTALADYSFCVSPTVLFNPSSITVPATVTSIGKKAFGYSYFEEENNNPIDSFLLELIADATDTDTFEIYISISSEDDAKEVYNYIMSTYFPEITENIYDEIDCGMTLTATKAQIMAMQNETNIYVSSTTDPEDIDPSLSDYIKVIINVLPEDTVVPINVSLNPESLGMPTPLQYKIKAKQFMNTYMDGSTDYRLNANNGELYFNATLKQIKGMSYCENTMVTLDNPDYLDISLFTDMYLMSDNDTVNIDVYNDSNEDNETFFKTFREKYFPDNKFENAVDEEQSSIYVFGVTKSQLLAIPETEKVIISSYTSEDDEPLKEPYKIKNFTVYGYNNSAAQQFAIENSLNFVEISGDYEKGDANLDGRVSIADATAIQKYLIETETFSDTQLKLADTNNDGRVSIMDATIIQKYLIGDAMVTLKFKNFI